MKSKDKDELLQSSSDESQSEDDENGWRETEELEKEFYKTLSQIKNKDPKIYDKNVEYFKDIPIPENKDVSKKKSTPLTLRDYERKIITEKGGELSDEESSEDCVKKIPEPTYIEEQESLKRSIKAVLSSDSEGEDDDMCGGLLKKRKKTVHEKEKEEEDFKEWLKGEKQSAPDEVVEKDMKPLRDYWTNPNLNEEDRFLRDYVLNKRFLEQDDENDRLNVEKLLEESEDSEKEEDEMDHNHQSEEEDQEYIKRYPRVVDRSCRKSNDRRKKKREKIKERKRKVKQKKRVEIIHKKKLKKKEIEDKIEELKRLTGNDQLAFDNVLDRDFDNDEYDQAMQRLFSEEFYLQDDPNFNPTDSMVFEDEWNEEEYQEPKEVIEGDEPLHCEDPRFIMDCDYDPSKVKRKEKSRSRRRKDKHRRTILSEAVKRDKPVFNPAVHKSFEQYIDQYYGIDCEDFIGDLPCRFKYRRTTPNSYGLTVEEILAADEKELERWCSIKRIQRLRPEFKEKGDVKVYKIKAADERLKRKILPSLFKSTDSQEKDNQAKTKDSLENQGDNEVLSEKSGNNLDTVDNEIKPEGNPSNSKKKKKLAKKYSNEEIVGKSNKSKRNVDMPTNLHSKRKKWNVNKSNTQGDQKDRKHKSKWSVKSNKNKFSKEKTNKSVPSALSDISDARLLAYGIKPKKFRNKLKYSKEA